MWGDEFEYQVQDFLKGIDDHIRELNAWWNEHGLAWLRYMSLYGIIAGESHFPFPPFALSTYQLLVGHNPRGDENSLRNAAEYWRDEALARQEDLTRLAEAVKRVNDAMQGPNAPTAAIQSLSQLIQPTAGLVQTQASIAQMLSQFYQQIVAAKAAFRAQVALMLGELITFVVMAVFTLGGSLVAAALNMGRRVVMIRSLMAGFRALLGRVSAHNFLTSVPQRLGARLIAPLPLRNIPPLLSGAGRRALTGLPRIPAAVAPPVWRGISTGARALGSGATAAARGVGRTAATAGRGVAREFNLGPATFHPASIAARRAAPNVQRGLIETAKRAGASRATVAGLRGADVRDGIAQALASRWRGQGTQIPARLAGRLSPDDLARIRTAVDDAMAGGLTVRNVLGRAAFSYGVRSAAIYGTAGWALQQAFIGLETGRMPPPSLSGFASSLVGAGLGGAPLAFGTRIPEMMVLGGIGGAAGFIASELIDGDVTRLLRAGGADDLLAAIGQGAVGGVWERFPGEASWSDSRFALNDIRYFLGGPRGLNLSGLVGEVSPSFNGAANVGDGAGVQGPSGSDARTPGTTTNGAPTTGARTGTPTTGPAETGRTPAPETSAPRAAPAPSERGPATSGSEPPVASETDRRAEAPEREPAPAPEATPPPARDDRDAPPPAAPPPEAGTETRPDPTDERRLPPPVAPPPVTRSDTDADAGPPPPPVDTRQEPAATTDGESAPSEREGEGQQRAEERRSDTGPDQPPVDHPAASSEPTGEAPGETTTNDDGPSRDAPAETATTEPTASERDEPTTESSVDPPTGENADAAPPADRSTVGTSRHTPPVHHGPSDPPREVRLSDDPGGLVTTVREQAAEHARTVPGSREVARVAETVAGWSDEEATEALRRVVGDANGHPGDPEVWKPIGDGWLIQGRPDGVPLVLTVGADGAVTSVGLGSFAGATTTEAGENSPAHKALGQVLTRLHDQGRLVRPDDDDPTTTVVLPDGSRVRVRWVVDPTLPEGRWTISPGAFTLTATGWRQDSPLTLGFSGKVRAWPDEAVADVGRQVGAALTTLARGLPGPVDPVVVSPAAGRVRAPEQSAGAIWRTLPTRVRVRPFDWDNDPPPPLPAREANDLLADVLAGLQSGESTGGDGPLVGVTGDPRQGVKLAHYDDGTTIAFVIDTGLAPTDTALVSPGTWHHDGEHWRQSTPTHIRVPASLSAEPGGRRDEMAELVRAALEEQHATRPGGGDRLHRGYDRNRLTVLEHLRRAGPLPVRTDAAGTGPMPRVETLPDHSGFLLSYPDVTVYAQVRLSGAEPGPDDQVTLTLPQLAEVDSGVWQVGPATVTVPGTDPDQADPAQIEAAVRQLGELLSGLGDLGHDAVVTLNVPKSRQLAEAVAATAPADGQPTGFVLLTDPLGGHPDQYLVRVPGEFAANAQAVLDQLAGRGYTLSDLADGWRRDGVPGVTVEATAPDGERVSLRLLPPDGIVARQVVARAAAPHDSDAEVHRRLWEHSGAAIPALLDDLRLPPPKSPPATPSAEPEAGPEDQAGPHRHAREPDPGGPAESQGGADRDPGDAVGRAEGDHGDADGRPGETGRGVPTETGDTDPVERAVEPAGDGTPVRPAVRDEPVVVQVPVGHADTVSEPRLGGMALAYTVNLVGTVPGLTGVQVSDGTARLEYGATVRTVHVTTVSDRGELPAGHARVGPDRIEISDQLPAGANPAMVVAPLMTKALTALGALPTVQPAVAAPLNGSAPSSNGSTPSSRTATASDEAGPPAPPASTTPAHDTAEAAQERAPAPDRRATDRATIVTVDFGQHPMVNLPDEVAQAASRLLTSAGHSLANVIVWATPDLPPGTARVEPNLIELSSHVPRGTPVWLAVTPLVNQALAALETHGPAPAAPAASRSDADTTREKEPAIITAQEGGDFVGHGGPWDKAAVENEALAAARDLASSYPQVFDAGYQVRYVPNDKLLVLDGGATLPTVAFRYTAGLVPDGVVAFTEVEPDRQFRPQDPGLRNVPVYRTTVSAAIPEASREFIVRRAVAHEVSEILERLAPSDLADLLPGPASMGPHEVGMLTELRIELADRATAPDQDASDRRIGQLLDRLGPDRLERVVRHLRDTGATDQELNLVRSLADPGATWRQEAHAQRRDAAHDAITEALNDLVDAREGPLNSATFNPGGTGPVAEVRPSTHRPGDPPSRIDLSNLVDELARDGAVGERLRVTALTRLTSLLTDQFGDRLGPLAQDPALTPTLLVARAHDAATGRMRFEYQRALGIELDRMRSDQLAAVRDTLPPLIRHTLPVRLAEKVLRETVALAADQTHVAWGADGGVEVSGGGRRRRLPAETVNRLRIRLIEQLSHRATLPRVRAEAVGMLGAELAPLKGAAAARTAGALAALGRLRADPSMPTEVHDAAEAVGRELWAADPLSDADRARLPTPGRELVDRVSAEPPRPRRGDPLRAMRPGRYAPVAADIQRRVTDLAAAGSEATRLAAELLPPVRELAETLKAAAEGFEQRQSAKENSAAAADKRAQKHEEAANQELKRQDKWAAERHRTSLADAEKERETASRHRRMAAAYEQATNAATAAHHAYQALRTVLDDLAAAAPADVAALVTRATTAATDADNAFRGYRDAVTATHPVELNAGVISGHLPLRQALADTTNRLLAESGSDVRVHPDELQRLLGSEWRWTANEEGTTVTVGLGDTELKVTYRHQDPVEVLDPGYTLTELILGQLPQFPHGSRVHGATVGRTHGPNVDIPLSPILGAIIPAEADGILGSVREALRFVTLDFGFHLNRRLSTSGWGTDAVLPGSVLDNRGESLLYSVDGWFEVSVRPDKPGARFSPSVRVDQPAAGDEPTLRTWVMHPYTVPAPTQTVSLADLEPMRSPEPLPRHVVTDLDGLGELYDKTLSLLGGEKVDEIARRQLTSIIDEEYPAFTWDTLNGRPLQRIVTDGKNTRWMVRLETELVPGTASLLGPPADVFGERINVASVGAGGGTTVASGSGRSYVSGLRNTPDTFLNEPDPAVVPSGGSVKVKYAPERSRHETFAATSHHFRPNVNRWAKKTQAFTGNVKHKVTVKRLGDDSLPMRRTVPGSITLRMPEAEAYRAGLPVAADAVRRDSNGDPVRRADGSVVLRDDPLDGPPPGKVDQLPAFLGNGKLSGAFGGVLDATGTATLRSRFEDHLRRQGLLPELDMNDFPILSRDPRVADAQLENLTALQQLSPSRIEGAYDQAAQGGIPLELNDYRNPARIRKVSFVIQLEQLWGQVKPVRHTTAEVPVVLNIASHGMTTETGASRTHAGGPEAGGSLGTEHTRALAADIAGQVGTLVPNELGLGAAWQHTNSTTIRLTDVYNRVTLIEGMGPSAVFELPHRLSVQRLLPGGGTRSVAEADGSARLILPGDLLPDAPTRRTYQSPAGQRLEAPTTSHIMDRATLLLLDATKVSEATEQVLPHAYAAGAAGRPHLNATINTLALTANDDLWRRGGLTTNLAVDPSQSKARQASLNIQGKLGDSRFIGAAAMVTGDIGFSMLSSAVGYGRQNAYRASGSGSGPFDAVSSGDEFSPDGKATYAHARTWTSGESRTSSQISGDELLAIRVGVHYLYQADVTFELTGTEETVLGRRHVSQPVTVDGKTVYAVPERDALKLYLDGALPVSFDQLVDALHRYATGHLKLDRHTAVRLVRRYRKEFASIPVDQRRGLPDLDKAQPVIRQLSKRLAEQFPDINPPPSPTPAKIIRKVLRNGLRLPPVDPDAAALKPPPYLEHGIGQAAFEPPKLRDQSGRRVGLDERVLAHIEAVSPGAEAENRALTQAVRGQLGGKRWLGKLKAMLGPRGYQFTVPVPVGNYFVEDVTVRISAKFGATTPLGPADDVRLILQNYGYDQVDKAGSRSVAPSRGGKLDQSVPDLPEGGGGLDRNYTHARSAGEQNTRIQRINSDRAFRLRRALELTVEVTRSSPRLRVDKTGVRTHDLATRRAPARPAVERLHTDLVQLVPQAAMQEDLPTPSPPDPRPVPLPESFTVDASQVDQRLQEVVYDRLAKKDMLGADGMAAQKVELDRQLSSLPLLAGLERMAGPGGYPRVVLPDLSKPGRGVKVKVRAVFSDLQITGAERPGTEVGVVDRAQHVAGERTVWGRVLPYSVGDPGFPDFANTGFAGSGSGALDTSITSGDRDETSAFEESTVVPVSVRVDYHLRYYTTEALAGGGERETFVEEQRYAVTGRAFLSVPAHRLAAVRERMEQGDPSVPPWRLWSDRATSEPRSLWKWLARRYQQSPTADLSRLLTEVANEPRTDVPALIAARLERDLGDAWRDAPVVRLTVDPVSGPYSGPDPITVARNLARDRGKELVVDVGETHQYWALPDGTLVSDPFDGGYARALATLDPELVERANEAGVDLRELYYDAMDGERTFTDVVRAALDPPAELVKSKAVRELAQIGVDTLATTFNRPPDEVSTLVTDLIDSMRPLGAPLGDQVAARLIWPPNSSVPQLQVQVGPHIRPHHLASAVLHEAAHLLQGRPTRLSEADAVDREIQAHLVERDFLRELLRAGRRPPRDLVEVARWTDEEVAGVVRLTLALHQDYVHRLADLPLDAAAVQHVHRGGAAPTGGDAADSREGNAPGDLADTQAPASPVPAPTHDFPPGLADQKYDKHVLGLDDDGNPTRTPDMPEYDYDGGFEDFVSDARRLLGDTPPPGARQAVRSDGAIIRLDLSGRLGIRKGDVIVTYFRPDDPAAYFAREAER